MGPMLLMGISQIRGYQPGDAEWGVKLEHVRGQAEAKEEIRRIVTLWQSGERFERSGGKRERGLLFLGAPGHRQDDARQGDRDRLQLALRDDPGLGLRADLRRPRLDPRPLPGAQGQAARAQMGRAVHRLHRRDRRRRHAAERARRECHPERRLRRADVRAVGRPGARDARVARQAVRAARAGAPAAEPVRAVRQPGRPGRRRHVRGRRRHGAQPAARRHGRARQPAARQADRHEHHQHAARRDVRRPADGCAGTRSACRRRGRATSRSTSSARRTSRSSSSIRRSRAPAGWAGTSGSARRRSRTARTSSTSTSGASRTTRISTAPSAATSSRG